MLSQEGQWLHKSSPVAFNTKQNNFEILESPNG